MSARHATHFAVYHIAPTESDPDGDEDILCGREFAEKVTNIKQQVTCKLCLRAFADTPAPTGEKE